MTHVKLFSTMCLQPCTNVLFEGVMFSNIGGWFMRNLFGNRDRSEALGPNITGSNADADLTTENKENIKINEGECIIEVPDVEEDNVFDVRMDLSDVSAGCTNINDQLSVTENKTHTGECEISFEVSVDENNCNENADDELPVGTVPSTASALNAISPAHVAVPDRRIRERGEGRYELRTQVVKFVVDPKEARRLVRTERQKIKQAENCKFADRKLSRRNLTAVKVRRQSLRNPKRMNGMKMKQ